MTVRGYVICSYPRSGTNYLCQLLASTGNLGNPQDWFNGPGIRARLDAEYPLEPEAQVPQARRRGSTENGVYGMKMFSASFERLAGYDWASALPGLRWVHLERHDLLGQAISDVRSTQTQQFRSTAKAVAEPRFDHTAIHEALARAVRDQARWKFYFARNAISPVQLTYEAILEAPQDAVDTIERLVNLGQTSKIRMEHVTLEIQRDGITEEWRRRFLSIERGLAKLTTVPSPAVLRTRRRLEHLCHRIAG